MECMDRKFSKCEEQNLKGVLDWRLCTDCLWFALGRLKASYIWKCNAARGGMEANPNFITDCWPDKKNVTACLELTGSAQPHVILSWQLLHPIAGLVHCDATHITADQLILVIVHVTVTNCAPVTCPPHLQPDNTVIYTVGLTLSARSSQCMVKTWYAAVDCSIASYTQ